MDGAGGAVGVGGGGVVVGVVGAGGVVGVVGAGGSGLVGVLILTDQAEARDWAGHVEHNPADSAATNMIL